MCDKLGITWRVRSSFWSILPGYLHLDDFLILSDSKKMRMLIYRRWKHKSLCTLFMLIYWRDVFMCSSASIEMIYNRPTHSCSLLSLSLCHSSSLSTAFTLFHFFSTLLSHVPLSTSHLSASFSDWPFPLAYQSCFSSVPGCPYSRSPVSDGGDRREISDKNHLQVEVAVYGDGSRPWQSCLSASSEPRRCTTSLQSYVSKWGVWHDSSTNKFFKYQLFQRSLTR